YDGVSTYQYTPLEDSVYPVLKSFGIKNIAQRMAGFDPYNLELAAENDVIISNVPAYSPESIAEYTLAQALNAIRKLYT
ncbi:2-hydroxyacid dehydrogenase, partial [Winkia sp. UMB3105]|nr:2-hydroxyacid dehydrogenase [Winkia sp. UMB3105]